MEHWTNETGRDGTAPFWKPLYGAIYTKKYDVAKWLYKNGAKNETFEKAVGRGGGNVTAFEVAFGKAADEYGNEGEAVAFMKWMIMQSVLEYRSNETLREMLGKLFSNDHHCLDPDPETMETELVHWSKIKSYYFRWVINLLHLNQAFRIYLLGTWRPSEYTPTRLNKLLVQKTGNSEASFALVEGAIAVEKGKFVWDSLMADRQRRDPANNHCLGAFTGVLQKIGDYVGVIKSKNKRKNLYHFYRTMKKAGEIYL